ncbi:MAG: hypothetical protein KW802_02225 [Candidatus Doudnabacteria bacterium]|nr:hypothetical protein [Candidatus Doudnabacteria bacterium]
MNLRRICPICAVVVLTWSTMLVWMWTGHGVDKIFLATLMGMSAGAIATKYAQSLALKSGTILLAAPAIWFLLKNRAAIGVLLVAGMVLLYLFFNSKIKGKGEPQNVDKFKDCC